MIAYVVICKPRYLFCWLDNKRRLQFSNRCDFVKRVRAHTSLALNKGKQGTHCWSTHYYSIFVWRVQISLPGSPNAWLGRESVLHLWPAVVAFPVCCSCLEWVCSVTLDSFKLNILRRVSVSVFNLWVFSDSVLWTGWRGVKIQQPWWSLMM